MSLALKFLWITSFLMMTELAAAQQIANLDSAVNNRWLRAEEGQVISFESGVSNNTATNQVDIYDRDGHTVAGINVLRAVPDASNVSIYDVASKPGKMIAIAAVFGKPGNVPPADVLMYLDASGRLLSALALAPQREISTLSIDDKMRVWTVTTHDGGLDPSKVPLVVEYDQNGSIVRELLPRSLFPMHASSIQENPEIGSIASGYSSGVFWFWLPGSTDLVTINTETGTFKRMETRLPGQPGAIVPLRIVREDSGTVLAEVRANQGGNRSPLAYFAWTPETKLWSEFTPDSCAFHRLIGVHGNEQVFAQRAPATGICEYARR